MKTSTKLVSFLLGSSLLLISMVQGRTMTPDNSLRSAGEGGVWKGTFTVRFQGTTVTRNEDNPELGHKFNYDHAIVVHFTTADGMFATPDTSDLGISDASEGDIMQQLQSGNLDMEALQKMADKVTESGIGTTDIMTWTASDGFDQTEIKTGDASVEMSANDKMHEVIQDVGEGYCCTIIQEGTWTGQQETKDFYIRFTVNQTAEKYDMEVKWKNSLSTAEYTYDFISLEKCPGWDFSCDPPEDYTETQSDYQPFGDKVEVKEPLQNLPLDDPDRLQGSKTLNGLFKYDDQPVDVKISWDIKHIE